MRKTFLILICLANVCIARDPYTARDFSNLIGMDGFTDAMLNMHFQLYQGYVKQTNYLLDTLDQMRQNGQSSSYQYAALKRRLGFEFDGMRLHELYFENLGGDGRIPVESSLYKQIVKQFGSYDAWKKDFQAVGLMRGVGWAVLAVDPDSGNLINSWVDEHEINQLSTTSLILVMDVWEHAFITQYGLNRAGYIDAFFKNINWQIVTSRFTF